MRILVLIHEYPPVGGGGGRVAQDICRGLVARGHEVHIITAHWGVLPLDEVDEGIQIHRVRSGRRLPYQARLPAMIGYVLAAFFFGLRLCRTWRPDIMHVHFAVPAGVAAWLLSLLTGIPYILTAHLGDVPGGVPEKTSGWFRWIFPLTPPIWKGAKHVTAVSKFTRKLALERYDIPMTVIPNGVDLEKLDPGSIHLQDPPRLAFAGRFVSQKNPLQFVQTLANIKDLHWTGLMMGDGTLRAEVELAIRTYNLEDRITLTGWLHPAEVLDGFRRCDILFMPSLSEGLPVVGVQAMALGLVLVLSRVGGCVEIVEPGRNGYLCDSGDTGGFSQILRQLLTNPTELLEMRQASREISARFDMNEIVSSYEKLLLGSI
jgi:L-malate glycosyltransferase